MNELYELIDNLKRNLDKDKTIVEIKKEMDILNNDLCLGCNHFFPIQDIVQIQQI